MNDGLAPPPGIALADDAPAPGPVMSREDAFRAGQPIASGAHILSVGGKLYSVPAEGVGKVIDAGGRFATPEESAMAGEQMDLANRPGEAALYGFARGATLGGSDLAAAKIGEDVGAAERLAGIKRQNAGVSTAAEITGAVAPMLIPGGQFTAAGAVGRAGIATEAAIGARLGTGIVAKAVARGAGGALEGAAFGAGQAISEAALENHDITAEALLSQAGTGAVFGGVGAAGIGGALDAGSWALRGTAGAGKKALGRLFARNTEAVTGAPAASGGVGDLAADMYAAASEVMTGAPRDLTKKFVGGGKDAAEARAIWANQDEVRETMTRKAVDAFGVTKDLTDVISQETFGVRPDLLRSLAKNSDPVAAHAAAEETLQYIGAQAEEMAGAATGIWGKKQAVNATLEDVALTRARMREVLAKGGPDASGNIANEMNWFKQRLGKRVDKNATFVGADDNSANARFVKWYEGGTMEDGVTHFGGVKNHLERTDIYGPAGDMMREVNAAASDYIGKTGFAKDLLLKQTGQDGFIKTFSPDSAKLATFLDGLGTARASTSEGIITDFMDAERNFVEVTRKYAPADSPIVQAAKGYEEAAAKRAEWLAEARHKVGIINQGKQLAAAQSGGMQSMLLGAGAASAVTGGAAAPFLAGAALAASPMRVAGALSLFDRAAAKMTSKADGAVGGVVSRAMGITKRAASAAGKKASALRGPALATAYRASAERAQAIASNGDPEAERRAAAIRVHAPTVAEKYLAAQQRANAFLASKLPPSPPPTAFSHLEAPRVAESQMRSFMAYQWATNHPDKVLEEIKDGVYVPEHIETLKALYPAVYARVRDGVTERLTKAKKRPDWESCQELNRAFGIECAPSQNPRFVATMQTIEGGDPSAQGQPPPKAGPATQAPQMSASVMSETDRIASR